MGSAPESETSILYQMQKQLAQFEETIDTLRKNLGKKNQVPAECFATVQGVSKWTQKDSEIILALSLFVFVPGKDTNQTFFVLSDSAAYRQFNLNTEVALVSEMIKSAENPSSILDDIVGKILHLKIENVTKTSVPKNSPIQRAFEKACWTQNQYTVVTNVLGVLTPQSLRDYWNSNGYVDSIDKLLEPPSKGLRALTTSEGLWVPSTLSK